MKMERSSAKRKNPKERKESPSLPRYTLGWDISTTSPACVLLDEFSVRRIWKYSPDEVKEAFKAPIGFRLQCFNLFVRDIMKEVHGKNTFSFKELGISNVEHGIEYLPLKNIVVASRISMFHGLVILAIHELAEKARYIHPSYRLKALNITKKPEKGKMKEAIIAGVNAYFSKEFTLEENDIADACAIALAAKLGYGKEIK